MSEEEKAKPITKPVKSESSSADDRKEPQEVENTDKGTGGLPETPLTENVDEPKAAENVETSAASSESSSVSEHTDPDKVVIGEKDTHAFPILSKMQAHAAEPKEAESSESSSVGEHKDPDDAENAEKDTLTLPTISRMKAHAAEPTPAESAESEAGTSVETSAEEAYFAQLEKDDTLIRKPKTLPIVEQPDLERSVRWGSVFLGKTAKLVLRIKGRTEPINIEVTGRYVIGRVHPRSEERPDLDLNKYGAFFHGVSREHVAINKDGNLLQIEDLGSTNGTYLNGMKLFPHQPRMLRDGDELCLGHLVMRVHFLNLESDLMH